MVESSYQSQYKDQSCWLQAAIVRGVDCVAEDDNDGVEQQEVRDVHRQLWQEIVDHKGEETKAKIVVNSNVREVNRKNQDQAHKTEDQSRHDENKHLSSDINDLPEVLVLLVLCLLVHVIQVKSDHINGAACDRLSSVSCR